MNSSGKCFMVSEKVKSYVFRSEMYFTNMLCSVGPSFRSNKRIFLEFHNVVINVIRTCIRYESINLGWNVKSVRDCVFNKFGNYSCLVWFAFILRRINPFSDY